MQIFTEISLILVVAALVSFVMRLLKQPLIVSYIFTGILVGPAVLNIFQAQHEVELLSKFGIAILLFIIGLHMSPSVVRDLGKVSLATGIGQIVFTSITGFTVATALGIPRLAALYTAIALTFSSTIIIVKLLTDKRDLNKLYAKVAVGFLLVQDVIATIILIFISTLNAGTDTNPLFAIMYALLKGTVLIGIMLAISGYVLPRLYRAISASQELVFLVSVAWGLGLAALFYNIGFSAEIGALVAGVALASTPYAYEIGSRMKPLRDFFIILFFILLGANMEISNIPSLLIPALILSFFVTVGNPLIMIMIMNLMGFSRRTSFQAGMATAQISEFSLILASIGFQVGHLSKDVLSLITLIGLVTISISTYMIMYSDKLYSWLGPYMGLFELRKHEKKNDVEKKGHQVVLIGYGRIGEDFVNAFKEIEKSFIVVDYDPRAIERMQADKVPFMYGDADDTEFLDELELHDVSMVVSNVMNINTNFMLIDRLKQLNPKAICIVSAHDGQEAKELYFRGATYVIIPHYLGGKYASRMIVKNGFRRYEYEEARGKHLETLSKRSV